MSNETGKIGWIDMAVGNATELRDFYSTVVGLKYEAVDMGGYSDYTMTMPAGGRFCVIEDPAGAVAAPYQP